MTDLATPQAMAVLEPVPDTMIASEHSTWGLCPGPHEDLLSVCLQPRDDSLEKYQCDHKKIYAISRNVERMLVAESRDERVTAAKEVLLRQPLSCLAYMVLAREGSDDLDQAGLYYDLAATLLKKERELCTYAIESIGNHDAVLAPYLLKEFPENAYTLIAGEAGRFFWGLGKQEQALLRVLSSIEEFGDNRCELSCLASSWLIESGQDARALSLLDAEPASLAQWYYMKAVLSFRSHGDSIVSRALLRLAITEDPFIAILLLGSELEKIAAAHEIVEAEGFVLDTRSAWHTSEGSLPWLNKFLTVSAANSSPPADSSQPVVANHLLSNVDTGRLKRWQTDYEIAQTLQERGDLKGAEHRLRSALREAERLGMETWQFGKTMNALIGLAQETGESTIKLVAILERQSEHVEKAFTSNESKLFWVSWHLGFYFMSLLEFERAEKPLARAAGLIETLLEAKGSTVTLKDASSVLEGLGFCLGEQSRYWEAAPCFRRSVELHEQFLGKNHPELVPPLDSLWRCLHHSGLHKEEAAVRERLDELDPDGDYDPPEASDLSGPWHVANAFATINAE